jgi:hypothetical protein
MYAIALAVPGRVLGGVAVGVWRVPGTGCANALTVEANAVKQPNARASQGARMADDPSLPRYRRVYATVRAKSKRTSPPSRPRM